MDEINVKQTFEDNIKDRIRNDIGDLIPDELLTNMISKSIDDILIKPKETKNDWGTVTRTAGLMEEITRELLTEKIKETIRGSEDIQDLIEKTINVQMQVAVDGLGSRIVESFMSTLIGDIQYNITNALTISRNNY